MINAKNVIALVIWYIPSLLTQLIGGYFTVGTLTTWYEQLERPFWNPPAWVFGPVWTILYILMTIAVWLVWLTPKKNQEHIGAYFFFFAQLIVNFLWSFFFFTLQSPMLALIDILVLLVLVFFTIRSFIKIRYAAGMCLIPYFLWLIYALSLNAGIWWLN